MKMNCSRIFSTLLRWNTNYPEVSTTRWFWLAKQRDLHSCPPTYRKKSHHDRSYPPQHPSGGYKTYKLLTWLVAIPAIVALTVWNYREYENNKRCYKRPPFVKYSYMYRRTKRFPWGDGNKSLFHNKEKNALPEGYED